MSEALDWFTLIVSLLAAAASGALMVRAARDCWRSRRG